MASYFEDAFDEFKTKMNEIKKAEFNYIVKGLNEAAEDYGFGDLIGGLDGD